MAQDRSAHDGKICVGTQKIMRELTYKVEQFHECRTVDLHRHVFSVQHDAVLIVIYIGRILETPAAAVNGDWNDPVVFSGGMVHSSGVPFILHTELAFGISGSLAVSGSGNRLGILLRLGQIDGNVYFTIFRIDFPFLVLAYPVAADIIAVLAELIEIVCGCLRRFLIFLPESLLHLGRPRGQTVHDLSVEKIPVSNAVFDNAPAAGFVQEVFQDIFQGLFRNRLRFCILVFSEQIQKKVGGIYFFAFWQQAGRDSVLYQSGNLL